MSSNVTVITASLPSRGAMLAEAVASVATQTVQPDAHLIGVDFKRDGSAATRNRLAYAADTEWLAFLDDDDLLYPSHLAKLLEAGWRAEADVVYSRCDGYDVIQPFDADKLRRQNFIAVTSLVRREPFIELGGFPESSEVPYGWEDHATWLGLLDMGCRFEFVDAVTWTYRLHAGSKTFAAAEHLAA